MEDFRGHSDTSRQPLLDTESQADLSETNCERSFQESSKADSKVHVEQNSQRCDRGLGELQEQCWLAVPMIYVNVVQYSIQILPVMFVGHLGTLALSSAAIASSFAAVTGNALMLGMGSTLETLCGQAYGAKQYPLLWLFLQRALVVMNATSVPIAILWLYMDKILSALGQDSEISVKAGEYARYLIPALFAYACLQPLVKYLQTQSVIIPMAILSTFTVLFHIPVCWLLIYKSSLSNRGAAVATSMSYCIIVILLSLYIKFSRRCEKSRSSFSLEALHGTGSFLKLAIPSALMICLEYWSFEFLVILSGLLPNPELETSCLSICLSTTSFVYMIPFGISAAVSTRVANELGAGNPQAARTAVYVALGLAVLETSIVSTSLFFARELLGRAYSSDSEVIEYVSSMMPLIAGTTILDGIQGVLSGIARGCGRQKFGAFINLGAYYVVGLPAAIILAFPLNMGGKGLWMGIFCGISVQTSLLIALTMMTNWEKQAEAAADRVSLSITETLAAEQ